MKSNRLTILAAVSLGVLAVLCCGYVSRSELISVGQNAAGLNNRITGLELEEGRICLFQQTFVPPSAGIIAIPGGKRFSVSVHPRLPSISRSIWEFDAHAVNIQQGVNAYIFAFPIWCLALPLTIAPILWLRRRNASKEQRGFTVERAPDRTGASSNDAILNA